MLSKHDFDNRLQDLPPPDVLILDALDSSTFSLNKKKRFPDRVQVAYSFASSNEKFTSGRLESNERQRLFDCDFIHSPFSFISFFPFCKSAYKIEIIFFLLVFSTALGFLTQNLSFAIVSCTDQMF